MNSSLSTGLQAVVADADSRVQHGVSEESFAAGFQRCRPMLLNIALRWTKSSSNAEDMVQQAFLQAWKARHSFQGNALFSTWLSRILINEIKQSHRRLEHQRLEYTDQPVLFEHQRAQLGVFPETRNVESELLRTERAHLARTVMNSLPPKLKSVLMLDVYAEKTTEEICVELNLTEAAVKARKLRGRLELVRRVKARYGVAARRS